MSSGKRNSVGLIILFSFILHCNKLVTGGNRTENMWRTAGRLTGLLIQNCMPLRSDEPQEQFLLMLQRCLKRRSLVVLDNSLNADVITIGNGVELVRYRRENETENGRELTLFRTTYKSNEMEFDWKNEILQRIAHVLNTRVLKIRLNGYEELRSVIGQETRGKKKQNMLMSLLMFGIAAVGLIMVPMGFQFLAVLGGKALLLAKMALILTAIQGLKKIATSNLNYGLYSAPPEHHHGPCKDDLCSITYNPLEVDDSVYVALDIDDLSFSNNSWHYDRKWPHEAEGHDMTGSYNNYYQISEQHPDLLHTLQPRVDTFKDMM